MTFPWIQMTPVVDPKLTDKWPRILWYCQPFSLPDIGSPLKRFLWSHSNHMASIATRVASIATRVASIATRVASIATRVASIATRVASIATRVESIATRVVSMATA
jgi:hypothetical protein